MIARRLPIGPKPFVNEVMSKVLPFGVAFFRIVKLLTSRTERLKKDKYIIILLLVSKSNKIMLYFVF